MKHRRPSLTERIAILHLLTLAVACAPGDGTTEPPPEVDPSYIDLSPGDVQYHTDPTDPTFLTSLSLDGVLLEIQADRLPDGQLDRVTTVHLTRPGDGRQTFEFDETGLIREFAWEGRGGLLIEPVGAGIAWLRFLEPSGAVAVELWMDLATGISVPEPEWGGSAPPLGASVGRGGGAFGDQTEIVTTIRGCSGQDSASAASLVDRVAIELEFGEGIYEIGAVRGEGGTFAASIPRQLTTSELTQWSCQQALAWVNTVCSYYSHPAGTIALSAICLHPSIATNIYAIAICFAVNAGATLICSDSQATIDRACAGFALPFSLGEWLWGSGSSAERRVRAVAVVNTCMGPEERESEWVTITAADLRVDLEVDGCVPELEPEWSVLALAGSAGFVEGSSTTGLTLTSSGVGAIQIPGDSVGIGPAQESLDCEWPNASMPLEIVQTNVASYMHMQIDANSAAFEPQLTLDRQLILADPNGAHDCVTGSESSSAAMIVFHRVYVRPFQTATWRFRIASTGSIAGEETTLNAGILWPVVATGTGPTLISASSPGVYEVSISHDDVRRVWEQISGTSPGGLPPGVPDLPGGFSDLGNQCFPVVCFIQMGCDVTQEGIGQVFAQPTITYDLVMGSTR